MVPGTVEFVFYRIDRSSFRYASKRAHVSLSGVKIAFPNTAQGNIDYFQAKNDLLGTTRHAQRITR